jgi:hypothetical protein
MEVSEMVDARESKPARRTFGIALIVAGVVLMSTAASTALAHDPGSDSRPAAAVKAQVSSPAGSDEPGGLRSNLGELPFTGLDLLILGGLAMVLLGTGMALRRLLAPRVL